MALGKQRFNHDLGVILVMSHHLIECHPFVVKYYFKLVVDDDAEGSAGKVEEGATSDVMMMLKMVKDSLSRF
jgi:hypothetical protein